MKRKKQSPCNADLPMELVIEVLARLPVKSLLRFRCVCKSWHSLISSRDFASLHLARYHSDDDENTPVLTSTSQGGTKRWMLRSAHTLKKITTKHCRNLDSTDFDCVSCYVPHGQSVNGLLLLSRWIERVSSTEIMLWNPIMGKIHKLPMIHIDISPSLDLGFDLSTNDYKVVAIGRHVCASSHRYTSGTCVYIYTLSTCTWRSTVNYRESIISRVDSDGVLIEGTLFWVARIEKGSSCMVSFDVKDEVFDYIELPSVNILVWRQPVAYRNWVGLLDVDLRSCSLWVMEKVQVHRAWSKLYTMDLQVHRLPDIFCFKKNGQLIFATREGGVKLGNIETQHMKHLMRSYSFYPRYGESYSTLYKESLVLL